jgi:hypothetical protein
MNRATGSTNPASVSIIMAERVIAAPRERVFGFLADLGCHWRLSDHAIELGGLERGTDGARGVIELHPPIPVDRKAVTNLGDLREGSMVAGTARIGRTVADVAWTLDARAGSTLVSLTAVVRRAGRLDRILLRLGGALWLRRRFHVVLERLDRQLAGPDFQEPRGRRR